VVTKELDQNAGYLKFEEWIIHRLIGEKFSYLELMDPRVTRIHTRLEKQSAIQASAAVPGPSSTQGTDNSSICPSGTHGSDNVTSSSSGAQTRGSSTPNPLLTNS